jgi:hypothetical protein
VALRIAYLLLARVLSCWCCSPDPTQTKDVEILVLPTPGSIFAGHRQHQRPDLLRNG